ncbi:MAG: DNA-binding protein, partial [Smithella sp.]
MSDEFYTLKRIADLTGIHRVTLMRRAKKENWPYQLQTGRGGSRTEYNISALPTDLQSILVDKGGVSVQTLPALAPEAALKALDQVVPVTSFVEAMSNQGKREETWTAETAISEADLQNPRIRRILKILREAENIPRNWTQGKRRWIESVALRNETDFRSIYRWIKKYDKRGIAGIRHSKSTAGKPKTWTPDAIDLWIGLCLKREHRKIDRKDLYRDCLIPECLKRGWNYGCYESANWWYERRVNPQLLALQHGGMRALDNVLPPVLRDYSDLQPFEILVGDQHRFDRWVVDEETGEVFRQEAYLWQDLRSRTIYGAAIDKKYDSWLIG